MSHITKSLFEKHFVEVGQRFPKLSYRYNRKYNCWRVDGELDICDTKGEYWGTFKIAIYVPQTYPYCVPLIQEMSQIIPRDIDWHISPDGICCIDITHRLIAMSVKGISIADFIAEKVYPFFANQLYRIEVKNYAGKEYEHAFCGIKQFYREELLLSEDAAIKVLNALTESLQLERNAPCLCGSGIKMKKCHLSALELLKAVGVKQLRQDLVAFVNEI